MLLDYLSTLTLLHIGADHGWFFRPAESHRIFGTGFIVIGALMTAETLAGGVWYRSKLRVKMFPTTLIMLGWGMLIVTAVEPNARVAHFAMGVPMIAGGWAEWQYRHGAMPR